MRDFGLKQIICNFGKVWKSLEKFFAGKETYNKVFLLEQLIDGKLNESNDPVKDIQDFIRQKSEIIRRLNEIGLQVNEELQVAIILARLPDCTSVPISGAFISF